MGLYTLNFQNFRCLPLICRVGECASTFSRFCYSIQLLVWLTFRLRDWYTLCRLMNVIFRNPYVDFSGVIYSFLTLSSDGFLVVKIGYAGDFARRRAQHRRQCGTNRKWVCLWRTPTVKLAGEFIESVLTRFHGQFHCQRP